MINGKCSLIPVTIEIALNTQIILNVNGLLFSAWLIIIGIRIQSSIIKFEQ